MKYTCALCGRSTKPYAFIGNMAIGPKCFKRMNIAKPRAQVKIVKQSRAKSSEKQPDLFDEQTNIPPSP